MELYGASERKERMSHERKRLGLRGELCVARRLISLGWTVLEHGWRCRAGEIDLIALDGDTVVFVEVKTRSSEEHGLPERSVGLRKRLRIIRAARGFLREHGWIGRPLRFDVAAVTPGGIRLIRGAFAPGGWSPAAGSGCAPRPALCRRLLRALFGPRF